MLLVITEVLALEAQWRGQAAVRITGLETRAQVHYLLAE